MLRLYTQIPFICIIQVILLGSWIHSHLLNFILYLNLISLPQILYKQGRPFISLKSNSIILGIFSLNNIQKYFEQKHGMRLCPMSTNQGRGNHSRLPSPQLYYLFAYIDFNFVPSVCV